MKGRLLYVVIAFVIFVFFRSFNANQMLQYFQETNSLEKTLLAERNIKNELLIERGDLISGRNITSLVPSEMSKFIPKEKAENIIYIREPEQVAPPSHYSIVDLITPKAEAATVVLPD